MLLRGCWGQGLWLVTTKSSHLYSGNLGRSLAIILKMYNFTHFIAAGNIIQGFPGAYEIKTTETASGLTGEVHLSDSLQGHCSHLTSSRLSLGGRLWTFTGWKLLSFWKALVSLRHFLGLVFKFFDLLGLPWIPEDSFILEFSTFSCSLRTLSWCFWSLEIWSSLLSIFLAKCSSSCSSSSESEWLPVCAICLRSSLPLVPATPSPHGKMWYVTKTGN